MDNDILKRIINNVSPTLFIQYFKSKNRSFKPYEKSLPEYDNDKFIGTLFLGQFTFEDGYTLGVYSFRVLNNLTERSGKKAQYEKGKKILKETKSDSGIFIFYDNNGNFRFSLIYIDYFDTKRKFSYFKRFTFYISPSLTNRTFRQQIGRCNFASFEEIKNAFSVEPVTKQFYEEIQNWYFWAMDKIKFPDDYKYSYDSEKDKEIRNATNLIRLITRIIFIWFLKEKGLVPGILFDRNKLEDIVKDFSKPGKCNYYNAILQNLFFATLNQKMKERKFADETGYPANKKEYGIKTLYRYADKLLISKEEVLAHFKDIPFLNGGLFDCLDKEDESGKVVYIDGFSRNPKKQALIPDYLFFQENEQTIDLSPYGIGNNRSVKGLIEILRSYNFTVDENTPIDQEIALDPELLGKVFENLLASYNPETATTARKATGSYYTPREIVDYMVEESLFEHFKTKLPEIGEEKIRLVLSYSDEIPDLSADEKQKIINLIGSTKILDPACGSGAFPMGILHKLVYLLQKIDPTNEYWHEFQYKKALSASEEVFKKDNKYEREQSLKEINDIFDESINYPDYARKLFLIENCIYGVDIQPIAIQISKLRFFISLVLDQKVDRTKENFAIRSLPNLETKFVAANTLVGLEKEPQLRTLELENKINELKELRHRYFTAKTRVEKLKLQALDKKIREDISTILIKDGFDRQTAQIIASFDPFDQNASASWFDPEWMFEIKITNLLPYLTSSQDPPDISKNCNTRDSGFDIVIGNPPHGADISSYKEHIENKYHLYETRKNSASLFIERCFEFLKPGGILSFVIPKSITFVEGWVKPRTLVYKLNQLLNLIDITKAFENVKLEQVILISKKFSNTAYSYKAGDYWDKTIRISSEISKDLSESLGILAIYSDEKKLNILKKLLKDAVRLGSISITYRGLPYQNKISDDGFPILRGRNIGKYTIYRDVEKIKLSKSEFQNSKIKSILQPKIISQNIVAHVMNPFDRLIIMSTYDKKGILTIDTVMNTFIRDSSYSYEYLLGILNSRLAEWFYYWFVYNRAIRTMHFDEFYIGKMPVKKISSSTRLIIRQIENHVSQILNYTESNDYFLDKTKQDKVKQLEKKIDYLIFELYNLTSEEIALVEGICHGK